MKICAGLVLAAAFLAVGTSNPLVSAEPPGGAKAVKAPNPEAEAALLKRAEAFVEAFDKGDAKAVAAFWAPEGDYTDQAGKRLSGREALEKSFAEFFAENKGVKVRIDIESLRFITPEVGIEEGVTSVLHPDGAPPSRAKYSIVHVKKDGQWYLGSVRETVYTPPNNYAHLKGLEGLIGEWAADAEKGEVARITFGWSDNQNFITASFATTFKNVTIGGATQWIGWDPAEKTVRSWSFHNNGGFGGGTWSQDGKSWTIKTSATLPDGKKATATDMITFVDADTIAFSARDRLLDGKALPDVKEVKLKRVK